MKTSPLEKRMIAAFWRSLEATYHKNDVVGAERVIPGAHGGIRVLYYAPPRPRGPVPVFFDLHGGGFIAGRPEMDDAFCDRLRRALNIAVIGVDYPLAPEKPYPADKEDVYDAVRYVFHHPEEFGADAANFSIGGHSAGGNIATVVCMMAKERGEFSFCCQILDYPPCDLKISPYDKPCPKGAMPAGLTELFRKCYSTPEQAGDAHVSPLYATARQLEGLPPALVIAAGRDSLREEDEKYAARLRAAGVPAEFRCFEASRHGFTIGSAAPDALEAQALMARTIANYAGIEYGAPQAGYFSAGPGQTG